MRAWGISSGLPASGSVWRKRASEARERGNRLRALRNRSRVSAPHWMEYSLDSTGYEPFEIYEPFDLERLVIFFILTCSKKSCDAGGLPWTRIGTKFTIQQFKTLLMAISYTFRTHMHNIANMSCCHRAGVGCVRRLPGEQELVEGHVSLCHVG